MQKAAHRATATRGSEGGCEHAAASAEQHQLCAKPCSISRCGESDDSCKMTYS